MRSPLVDLGVGASGRIDDCGRGARLVADPHEVVENRLRGQLLDDAGARPATSQARRHDGDVETLQCARDVDALAAGEREALAGAMPVAELKVRNGERPVERRVQRHGHDHENQPPMCRRVRPA